MRALRLMVRAWLEPLVRFCTAMLGSPAEAEEVAQESFLAAYAGMERFRAEASPRTWLCCQLRRRRP